jgi:hypothetical protein
MRWQCPYCAGLLPGPGNAAGAAAIPANVVTGFCKDQQGK